MNVVWQLKERIMLLVTIVGVLDTIEPRYFGELEKCLNDAICDAVAKVDGRTGINQIIYYIPKPLATLSYRREEIFVFLHGFYTDDWVELSQSKMIRKSERKVLKDSIPKALSSSIKTFLEKFGIYPKVQFSIPKEDVTIH